MPAAVPEGMLEDMILSFSREDENPVSQSCGGRSVEELHGVRGGE